LVYWGTWVERCNTEGVALLLVVTAGSDSPDPVVLVAEVFELAIRKPVTTTTTTRKTKAKKQTYFIHYFVVKIKVIMYRDEH
jgi:hypothetical protein